MNIETYSITYKSQTEFAPDLWNQVKRTFKPGKKFRKEKEDGKQYVQICSADFKKGVAGLILIKKDNLLFTGKLPLRFLTLEKNPGVRY